MALDQPPNTNREIMPTPHDGGVTAPLNRRNVRDRCRLTLDRRCCAHRQRPALRVGPGGAANGHYGGLKGPRPALGWI